MKKQKKYLLIAGLIGMLFFCQQTVDANEFNFAVTPVIPENQIDKTKTYFDLLLARNASQELTIDLTNDTNENVTIEIGLNNATTNLNGVVEYGPNEITPDKSLKYKLNDIVEVPEEVTLDPHSSQAVNIKVHMPNDAFDGLIAGGLTFKEKKEEKMDEKSDGLAITNEYSYVIALLLRENQTAVAPKLNLLAVKADQVNARNVISAKIQNSEATYINQVAVDGTITKKGSTDSLYSISKDEMQIAPNTHFDFPVHLNGKKLQAGTYHIKLDVYGNRADDGTYTRKKETYTNHWLLEKDFTISGETASRLNQKDVTIKPDHSWLYMLLLLLILLILFLILFLILKKKRREDE
ncbi:DUF916 and DUF3324 domain-containing protein [Enterococcus sp. ZJ1622]|uniref:DUF916 and DUF3324 domain-containing protein n=1 Tax=Enterococcus sp. ZJ1622 TaxID=2709401 RepID=UPI0013EC9A49|nr:DUF916 and DUF3324 domain-containing protein [Enterococcus sp. ZJ1622]